MESSEIH